MGKLLSARAAARSWSPIEDLLGDGFEVLVDERTSRHGPDEAVNNYDHFIVTRHFADTALVAAGAVNQSDVAQAESEAGVRASDHFPIALTIHEAD